MFHFFTHSLPLYLALSVCLGKARRSGSGTGCAELVWSELKLKPVALLPSIYRLAIIISYLLCEIMFVLLLCLARRRGKVEEINNCVCVCFQVIDKRRYTYYTTSQRVSVVEGGADKSSYLPCINKTTCSDQTIFLA